MNIRAGDWIDSISFLDSNKAVVKKIGGSGGTSTNILFCPDTHPGSVISGANVTYGSYLNTIQPVCSY